MAESNLILILKTYTRRELKDFRAFVSSPFFNTNKNVVNLIENLSKGNTGITDGKIDMITLHKKIYPGKIYKEENMKTLIHLLTRLAEKYLAYTEYINSPGNEKIRLLKAFDKRNLQKQYKKLENSYSEELSLINKLNIDILYRKMWFEKTKSDFYSSRAIEKELHHSEIEMSEITIALFFVEMFQHYNMFWRLDYIDYEIETEFVRPVMKNINIEKIDKLLREGSFKYYPLFEAYYCLYRSIDEDEEVSDRFLERFGEILNNNDSLIEKSEQFVLSTILVNFVHYLYRKNFSKYERKLFESFKMLLKLYKYSGEKYLRLTIFTNILRFGIQVKEFEWIKDFIQRYSPMLEENQRENMYNYGRCFLAFALKDYEMALEHESKIDYSTMQMKYYMRDVRLCSLYELGQFESALNLIDSYRHFIKNEKNFKRKMKIGYKDFVENVNLLIKLNYGNSRITARDLKERIENSDTMRKVWLAAKADELISSSKK